MTAIIVIAAIVSIAVGLGLYMNRKKTASNAVTSTTLPTAPKPHAPRDGGEAADNTDV